MRHAKLLPIALVAAKMTSAEPATKRRACSV
jgi:hypothetical protein